MLGKRGESEKRQGLAVLRRVGDLLLLKGRLQSEEFSAGTRKIAEMDMIGL